MGNSSKTITQNNALLRAQLRRQIAEIDRESRKLRRKIFWLKLRAALRRTFKIFPPSGGEEQNENGK